MLSRLAFLRSLTLPSGAGPNDSRIVLDGLTGEILIYRLGVLVGRWRAADFSIGANLSLPSAKAILQPAATPAAATVIFLDPPDSGTLGAMVPGQFFCDLQSSDDTPFLGISGPRIDTETGAPRMDFYGSNGATPRRIAIAPNAGSGVNGFVDIPQDAAKTSDFRLDNISFGRGLITGKDFVATSDEAGHTGSGNTDMLVNNVPIIGGRAYEVWLKTGWDLSAAGVWSLNLAVNGTKIDEFDQIQATTGLNGKTCNSCIWEPSATATTDDLLVTVTEISGASTLTLTAAADQPRRLYIKDIGVL